MYGDSHQDLLGRKVQILTKIYSAINDERIYVQKLELSKTHFLLYVTKPMFAKRIHQHGAIKQITDQQPRGVLHLQMTSTN